MKFFRNKKIIFIVLLSVLILGIGQIKIAHADGIITGVMVRTVYSIVWGIIYLIGYIGGICLTIVSAFLDLAVQVNLLILSGPYITNGWNIVLNFTNLGFVLAIIIIAFATIFRVQSYAMKQTLGKLIAAALLVNFSLVIAGAFINISHILTNFFLDQFKQESLSTKLTSILNAQMWGDFRPFDEEKDQFTESNISFLNAINKGIFKIPIVGPAIHWASESIAGILTGEGGSVKDLMPMIAAVFVAAFFTFLIVLTIFAVAIMMFIRYVYLGILLILSPIVWLLWIFPSTQHLWQKWWSQFLRWTFFAPLVLFFLYLAIMASEAPPTAAETQVFTQQEATFQTEMATKQEALAPKNFPYSLAQIGQMVIILGLIMGGLMAANSLGITFSSTAMGWAQGVGKQFGGWVGRKGVRLGTAPLRTKAGRGAFEGMQKAGLGMGRFGRVMTSPIRYFGETMSGLGVRQGEQLVADAEKRVGAFKTDKSLADAFSTLPREQQIAAAKRLMKNKSMNLLNEKDLNYYIGKETTKKSFARFGAEKDYDDFEKAAGRNTKMVQAKTPEEKEEAAKEFHKTFKPKDYENIRTKAFTEDKEYAKSNIIGMMSSDPGALSKLFPKLSGKDLDTSNPESFYSKVKQHYSDLKGNFDENIDKFIHTIDATIDIGSGIGMEAEKKLKWLREDKRITGVDYDRFEEENKKLKRVDELLRKNLNKRFEEHIPPEEYIPPAAV